MKSEDRLFFERNGYVVFSDLLTREETSRFQDVYDRDREETAYFWREIGHGEHQTVNCDSLISSPEFDGLIRHPGIVPLVQNLLEAPPSLAEVCLRHMRPHDGDPVQKWHRDAPHDMSSKLRTGWVHVLIYLSDVTENSHCFSISPERFDQDILDKDQQLSESGAIDIHGPAGTIVFFNLSVLHTATVRRTDEERKTIQTYYGRQSGPTLSHYSLVPTSLWRDHPDPQVRAFYGDLNDKSRRYAEQFP